MELIDRWAHTCEEAICAGRTGAGRSGTHRTAAQGRRLDEQTIDRMERSIEALCLKLLLQQQDRSRVICGRSSAALKMITDMERIGDQAADIAEIIPFLLSHNTFDCTLVCRMAQQASSHGHAERRRVCPARC